MFQLRSQLFSVPPPAKRSLRPQVFLASLRPQFFAPQRVPQESKDPLIPDPVRVAVTEALIEAKKLKPTKKPNHFVHNIDGTTRIFLERRDGAIIECLIDTISFDRVKDFRWYAAKTSSGNSFYARTAVWHQRKEKAVGMQVFLKPGFPQVDHKNRNTLVNTLLNLRPATSSLHLAPHSPRRPGAQDAKDRHKERI
jgi:hypothetical protein